MPLTGPILPKAYGLPNNDAPTPTVATSITNEIITCTRTGRMWVNWRDQAMVPIRPEWSHTDAFDNVSTSGIRQQLVTSGPFTYSGVEIYGAGLKVGRIESSGDVISTSTMQCAAFTMNSSSTFNVTTSSVAANPIHLRALKPTMSNDGTTATGANRYWFSVTNSLGCEFGDSGGASGAYRLNAVISGTKAQFERVIEANDGVKITDIPNAYRLGTFADGTVANALVLPDDVDAPLSADLTLSAGVATVLTDLTTSIGTAGITSRYLITLTLGSYHNGNHSVSFNIRDHLNSLQLGGGTISASGYANGSVSVVYTVVGTGTLRVIAESSHAATIKQLNQSSTPSSATKLCVVRLA